MPRFWKILLLAAIWLPQSLYAIPARDPSLDWQELDTRHLRLQYPARLSLFAAEVSRAAESAFDRLRRIYGFDPGRTAIVLWDTNENTNGAALAARNQVTLYGAAGTLLLRGWHPWIANVASHEFSHIFSLRKARVLPAQVPGVSLGALGRYDHTLDSVFAKGGGSFYLSAESVPRWFAEGIAQFDASQADFDGMDSTRLRLRRAALIEGKEIGWTGLETTRGKSQIGAELVYNEGFAFVTWLASRYGEPFLAALTRQPALHNDLNFNRGFSRLVSQTAEQLFNQFLHEERASLTATTSPRLPEGFKAGISDPESLLPGKRLITKGRYTRVLIYGSQQWQAIVGSGDSVYDEGNLYMAQGTTVIKDDFEQAARNVLGRPAFAKDGSIYYCSVGKRDFRGYAYSHLYRIADPAHPAPERLVKNLRCLDLVMLPDGKLVATVNRDQTLNLDSIAVAATSATVTKLTHLVPPQAADQPAPGAEGQLLFVYHDGQESDLAKMTSPENNSGFERMRWPGSEERSPMMDEGRLWWLSDTSDQILDLWSADNTQAVRHTAVPAGLVSTFALPQTGSVGVIAYRHEDFHPRSLENNPVLQAAPAIFEYVSWPVSTATISAIGKKAVFRFARPLIIPEMLFEYEDFKSGVAVVFGDTIGLWQAEMEVLAGVDADASFAGAYNGWYLPIEFRYDYYRRHRTVDLQDLGFAYRQRNVYHSGTLSTSLSLDRYNYLYTSLSASRFELLFPSPSPLTWQNLAWDSQWIFQNVPPSPEADVNPRGGYLALARAKLARSFSARDLFPGAGVDDYLQLGTMGRGYWGLGQRVVIEAGLQGDVLMGWNPAKNKPVIPDLTALDELFLGGEFFTLRRGLFQTYKGFAGYDEFAVSGEWMVLADILLRFKLGEQLWSAGPFYLDGLYIELSSGLGRAWPTGTGWVAIRDRLLGKRSLFVKPASLAAAAAGDPTALANDAGFLAESSIALRTKMILWGAFPWNSYLKLARGWQDPGLLGYRYDASLGQPVQGEMPWLPFRVYLGVGTGF